MDGECSGSGKDGFDRAKPSIVEVEITALLALDKIKETNEIIC
jgi:hypothetical protein